MSINAGWVSLKIALFRSQACLCFSFAICRIFRKNVSKMGLGVLEDHHLQHVPGTALLADIVEASQHQYHGRDTSVLRHGTGRNADIILVPQPSESPRDPLNWPQWKKELLLLIISIDTAVVGAWGPMISPGYAEMAIQFNMSYNSLNGGLGWAIFAIGISCFVTNGLSVKYGRRPVMILGNLMLFISSVWAYHAHTYESLLASRIFGAIGMSPFEVLTTVSSFLPDYSHILEAPADPYTR
jgi:hypothetical protein